jgi:dTDP-4-dehydrorhamnose reductase
VIDINTKPRVLVLGATGMLGNAVLRYFVMQEHFDVIGSVRSRGGMRLLPPSLHDRVIGDISVDNVDSLAKVFAVAKPDAVINCVGLVKQLAQADDPLEAIPINSVLPHRLARLCAAAGARLVHVSTDCVFSGTKGMYTESDTPDANDLYGRTKYLGEVDYPHAVTLRTSIIGHELGSSHGLIDWFLSQESAVRGFTRAIFSGVPTVELARIIHDFVLPNAALRGLFHVSAAPISKYDLLQQVARVYGKVIDIAPDDKLVIDRSLNSSRFQAATGYAPPAWPALIEAMHGFR